MPRRVRSAFLALAMIPLVLHPQSTAADCPTVIDEQDFAGKHILRAWNKVLAQHGPRPTASDAHERYIDWVAEHLEAIDGIEVSSLGETIDRQIEEHTTLSFIDAHGAQREIPVAGPVPYTRPGTSSGELVYLPPDVAISASERGKIVVRDAVPGAIPHAVFGAVAWYAHDPDLTFDPAGSYERDWTGAAQRVTDLQAAQDNRAAGVVFVHGLPRQQVEGQYGPYTGDHWRVPGVYVGADEGEVVKVLAGTGTRAEISIRASRSPAFTRTLVGRLPGQTEETIVIESHTDGMNAVWDNGPVSLLALASYYAALPESCRQRTLEFVFTTAHLYLTHAGAHRYAEHLDETYDDGEVAFVMALEHLGAREFEAVPRQDGGPGRELVRTGHSELFATFASESVPLITALVERVRERDLRRTWVLRGADAPAVAFPPHRSYGGEGGPYREHLIPTVAGITGPWTLFNPNFGMDELIDFRLMRRQTLAFGDLVLMLDDQPRELIAGLDPIYRIGRDVTGL